MWKNIPESKYQATETGQIRHKKFKRILKHFKGPHCYPAVQFHNSFKLVHRLVLLTFKGNPPLGHWARHLDGNPRNCHLSNLEWATPEVNNNDRKRHGTEIWGERNGLAKLTEKDVKEIRRLYIPYDRKYGSVNLGKMFNVAYQTIGFIVRKETWKHI